jgi:hypothetical protein
METKVCCKCRIEKHITDFPKDKSKKDGLYSYCKECTISKFNNYKQKNPEKVKKTKQEEYIKNIERYKFLQDNFKELNPNYQNEYNKEYYLTNCEKIKEKRRNYYLNNKEKENEYSKERRKYDIIFNLKCNIRSRIYFYLKKNKISKNNKTFDIVGCTPEFLKKHLEKKFIDGMTWENQGEWHIDHIIPLSSAKTEEELYKLCYYSNLQPLWAGDNLSKGNKVFTN